MKKTRTDIMGMPITIDMVGNTDAIHTAIDDIFHFFELVDMRFSTYKEDSEIMHINNGLIASAEWSAEMNEVFECAAETKRLTYGYFNIEREDGFIDPSGIVKGWSIHKASDMLRDRNIHQFSIEVAGDIEVGENNEHEEIWRIGIRNPFNLSETVKRVGLRNAGIATSGNYVRGNHIYNPHNYTSSIREVVSMSVIGPNVYEADRYATAAFAMGTEGIDFIESIPGLEGYVIWSDGTATPTSRFNTFVI